MAALNIFLGGNSKISKDTMSEFFNNLLMQDLIKSDDSVLIKFNSISQLVKNFNEKYPKKNFQFKK